MFQHSFRPNNASEFFKCPRWAIRERDPKMKIVVIGGNGLIGKKVVLNLRQQGHEAVAASPSSGVNTVTGEGLSQALASARVVVDVANAPSWDNHAVLAFF